MKYFLCALRSSMLDEKTIETVVNYFLPSIEFKLCDYIVCFINVLCMAEKPLHNTVRSLLLVVHKRR